MKEVKLTKLSIENFKGMNRVIDFGETTVISGANATGKTTVFDAFTYLLFGKNSSGDEKFAYRPLDFNGNFIHNIEITVEGEFEIIDGDSAKSMTLKKTSKEKWVKRRGSDVAELQGNENAYEIDGYPRTEREYKETIASLVDEKVFKLITNPKAFTSLPWKEQRAILMGLFEQMTDVTLAMEFGGYDEILDELEKAPSNKDKAPTDYILDKYKKELSALKEEQKGYPVRIDEIHKQGNEAAQEISKLRAELSELEPTVSEVSSEDFDSKIYEAGLEKSRLESELRNANSKFDHEQSAKEYAAKESISKAEYNFTVVSGDYNKLLIEKSNCISVGSTIKGELAKLDHELDELSQKQMDESKLSCPVCGRRFTEKKIDKIKEDFYKHVDVQMSFVRSQIDEKKKELATAEKRYHEIVAKIAGLEQPMSDAKAELEKAKAAYKEPEKLSFVDTDEYMNLAKKIADVISEIDRLEQATTEQTKAMRENADKLARIKEIQESIKSNEAIINMVNARIEELQSEQRSVSQKVMNCEKMLNLVESFIRQKMEFISTKVNNMFEGGVGFKLFDQQINGGIKETCECTIHGVPYSSANNGHQIVAGLNIINVLQRVYGVFAPIFIDNAESVNRYNYPAMDSQVVYLMVTEDEELKVSTF